MSNPLPRTVAALLVALLTTSAGCGPSSSDHRAVVADNETLRGQVEALQSRLQELTARNEELEAIHDGTRVSLANTELHRLTSRDNGETHEIKVWRPRGYAQGTEPLPVLYVIDAETNFGGVSYIVQRLIKDRLIPEMLVVGIAYGTTYDRFYELRGRDLTPTKDPSFRRGKPSGEAPAFSIRVRWCGCTHSVTTFRFGLRAMMATSTPRLVESLFSSASEVARMMASRAASMQERSSAASLMGGP